MSLANVHHVREQAQSQGSARPLALELDRLLEILDRPIAFHRVFVALTGSVTAALMLSQGLYWTRIKRRDAPGSDGWFYKTQAEWEDETGMGRSEQETARKRLRRTSFWQEERRGLPAKLYFRIDLERLADALLTQPPTTGTRRENRQQNHQNAEIQHASPQDSHSQAREDPTDKRAPFPQAITETTAETTLPETPPERENNVVNVASHRTTQQKPPPLTDREEVLAEEIARHLDGDGHSLGAIRRIVGGLGEAITYRLFDETMEQVEAHKIKTTPGRYFIDLAKRDAARQGIDLGFRQKGVSHSSVLTEGTTRQQEAAPPCRGWLCSSCGASPRPPQNVEGRAEN
jgi:hypothetical protein